MQIPFNKIRRGMTVLEVTIALGLLAMGMALTAQVFTLCAGQHLAGQQLLVAQWEAANVLEHLAGLRYEEVTPEAVQSLEPSPQLQAALPAARLHVMVTNSGAANAGGGTAEAGPPHKRLQVEVTWAAGEGPPRRVMLTAWKFPTSPEAVNLKPEAVR
jgi:hypothetical protein